MNVAAGFGGLYLVVASWFLIESFNYPYMTKFGVGSGFFPRWVSVFAIIVGIVYLLTAIFKDRFIFEDIMPDRQGLQNVLLVIMAIIVFIFLTDKTGFIISASLLLFTIFIREYPWWKAILLAIVVSTICFLIFRKGFSVPLPVNRWGF